jgi:hypothetical protein
MKACKIDHAAKMAKLLTAVRKDGKIIEAWAASDDREAHSAPVRRTMTILLPSAQHRN